MKSVGEVMAIGRTQQESLAAGAARSGRHRFRPESQPDDPEALTKIRELEKMRADRILHIADAFRAGLSVDGVFNLTNIDRWSPVQIEELARLEEKVAEVGINAPQRRLPRVSSSVKVLPMRVWRTGGVREAEIRKLRDQYNLHPVHKRVDGLRGGIRHRYRLHVPTYEDECEANPSADRDKIMVLGGGPNRIGQALSLTNAAIMPRWRCAKTVTRPSHGQL